MDNQANTLEHNKAIAKTFLEVFSTGKVPRIAEQLHDEARWWVSGKVPGISDTYSKVQMLALLEQVTAVYKKGALQITPSSMIAEGNQVAVEAESPSAAPTQVPTRFRLLIGARTSACASLCDSVATSRRRRPAVPSALPDPSTAGP